MPRKLHQVPPYTSLPVSSQAESHETAFPSSSRATMSASEPCDNGNDHAHDNRHDHSDWSDLFSQARKTRTRCPEIRPAIPPRLVRTYIVRAQRCCTSRRRKKGSKYGITAHGSTGASFSCGVVLVSPGSPSRRNRPIAARRRPPAVPPSHPRSSKTLLQLLQLHVGLPQLTTTHDDKRRHGTRYGKRNGKRNGNTERTEQGGGHRNEKGKSGSKRWLARFRMRIYIHKCFTSCLPALRCCCCCLHIIKHPGLSSQYLLLSQLLRTNPTLD